MPGVDLPTPAVPTILGQELLLVRDPKRVDINIVKRLSPRGIVVIGEAEPGEAAEDWFPTMRVQAPATTRVVSGSVLFFSDGRVRNNLDALDGAFD